MKVGFVSIIKMSSYKTTSMRDVEGRNTVTEVKFWQEPTTFKVLLLFLAQRWLLCWFLSVIGTGMLKLSWMLGLRGIKSSSCDVLEGSLGGFFSSGLLWLVRKNRTWENNFLSGIQKWWPYKTWVGKWQLVKIQLEFVAILFSVLKTFAVNSLLFYLYIITLKDFVTLN